MEFCKYQGAGNDFLIADNRNGNIKLEEKDIAMLCDRRYGVGADGLMLLENSGSHDFRMVYYNSDGSGGMMCGNGGRCIVAFAADLGFKSFSFEAADGTHYAEVVASEGRSKTVRLSMADVEKIYRYSDGTYFMNTGTRHFVKFTDDIAGTDVKGLGSAIRYDSRFAPEGTNVNFVYAADDMLYVRTYEKGVEDETYACGTGIVASAIASYCRGDDCFRMLEHCRVEVAVHALKDMLSVEFVPDVSDCELRHPDFAGWVFSDVFLTGPAVFVASVNV